MKEHIQKIKKRITKKHGQLLLDTVLVFLPFANSHFFSIPVAIFCIAKIAYDFYKSHKEQS